MNIKNLRKSILQYAVEGKLVQQDIQDESASILYDKIIKEKENLINQGQIKKEKPLPPVTDDEIPYNIPESWKWVRLGEVCVIKRGKKIKKNDFTNNGIPCIHYGQIHKYYKYSTNTTITYTSEQIGNKLKTVEYSDIIMAVTSENMNDVCKSIAWLGNYPIVTGGHTAIIKHSINPLYLIYLFNSSCFQIQKNKIAKGMKVIEVSSEKLKNIIFPLPPLKEQERIVKKVDKLMALCDKLEQEEEKLLSLDKYFADNLPKSILQYAVEGKLVQQDIQDESASILYDKIIKEKENLINQGQIKKEKPLPPVTDDEIPYNIPENWKWVRLGDIAVINGGYAFKSVLFKKQGIRVIRISDFNEDGFIDKNIVRYEYTNKLDEYILNKNNIILCMTGGTVGKSLLIKEITEPMATNQRVATIKINTIKEQYIHYVILSNLIQNIIQKEKISTNDNISLNTIKYFLIPLPPLKEQERIVKKVDELLTYCNKLKDII